MRNITSLGQARDYGDRLSKLLKKYRELANFRLTQGDLANRVGVSARSIRDWESGINLPTARNLKKIIEVYHQSGLFTAGKESEEAEELWILRQGKDLSNTFPLFDVSWLEIASSTTNKSDVTETEVKLDLLAPDQTTTTSSEKDVSTIPTKLMSGNLPLQLTSFIGREKELAEIKQLLSKTRLLTITGTGGAGKTRLSQEFANQLQETAQALYPDGIWWIELTPLADPPQVVQVVISALMPDRRQEGDLYELLRNFLQPRKLLLVLDNCEHLLEAVAGFARKLLRDCPSLQILATSRESLNVAGEQAWLLEGLSVPGQQKYQLQTESMDLANSAAVRLFVERARATQYLFELTTENTGAVLSICRQLDGLPLAIELAATRVKGLGVEQIARRLQQNFKLLSGGNQASAPHHQTVQAMIDWSYQLLTTEEQLLLRRVAVFRGDFSLEAAEAVLGGDAGPGSESLDPDDVLILMLQLVSKSLVVAVSSETQTETRYRLLEMVRQYSQEKLEESLEAAYLSYKHLAFYTDFVEKNYNNNFFTQMGKWVIRLEQDIANLRLALSWALAASQGHAALGKVPVPVSPPELALRLSTGLGWFWYLKSYISEGEHWLEASLALDGLAEREDLKDFRARAYLYLAPLSATRGLEYITLSLALFEEIGDKFHMVGALNNLGAGFSNMGNYVEAKGYLLRSLALNQEIENQFWLGYILSNLGRIALYQGDLDEALAFFQKSELIHRLHNDYYPLAYGLIYQSEIYHQKQDLPQAMSKLDESLQVSREYSYKPGIALALIQLSVYQRNRQTYVEARLAAEEAVTICKEIEDSYDLASAYNSLAIINIKEGRLEEARRVSRQSLEIQQKNGDKTGIMNSFQTFGLLAAARNHWEEYIWLCSASDTLRQQLGISRDHLNEQAELARLDGEAALKLDPATLDQSRVKGQTDSLDEIVKQLLAI